MFEYFSNVFYYVKRQECFKFDNGNRIEYIFEVEIFVE